MAYFNDLDQLISSQGTLLSSNPSPAEVLAEKGCPSTSIAVLNHGNITSHCISTLGDNDQTLFQACSISKPIAGMATMKLVQQGKLRISDKIIDILPKSMSNLLETPQTKHLLPQITVKHLMSHTSGLSVGGFAGYSGDLPSHEAILSGNAPSNTLQVRLYGLPGYDFTYSGGGMMVLQIILETVTGKDFPTLMQELIFEPLGMSRSFYRLPETETNIAHSHYTGYTPSEDKWRVNPEQAAAGLWTTPTDLLKAIRAVQQSLRNTTNSEETILVKEIAQQMLTEVQGGMALTWVAPRDPGLVFGHGGSNFPGWRCFVVGFGETPSRNNQNSKLPGSPNGKDDLDLENSGICVMTNSMCGDRIVWKVIHAISSFMKWPRIPSVGFWYIGTIPFTAYSFTLDPEWKDWSGTWIDEENKDKILTLEADSDGSPILRYGKDLSAKLVPAAIPGLELVGKRSIGLNIEGLEMMLRLAWKEDSRVMELWQGGNGSASISDFKSKEN